MRTTRRMRIRVAAPAVIRGEAASQPHSRTAAVLITPHPHIQRENHFDYTTQEQ